MKTRCWILFAGIAMFALPLLTGANPPQKSQQRPPKSMLSKDESAILAAEEASMEVIRKRDVDGYMKFYAHRDDLTVYDTGESEAIVGWDACRKHWEEQFAGIRSIDKLELSKIRVHASGDMGFLTATWALDVTTNEGEKASQTGRMTDIFQKIDGKWLIIHEHNSLLNGNAEDVVRPPAEGDTVRYARPDRRGDGKSGIQGVAMIGPVSPVDHVGVPNTRPFPEAVLIVQEAAGNEIARVKADAQGKFHIALLPGTYHLIATIPNPNARLPRGSEQTVTVRKGEFATVEAEYDSGIR